MVANLNFSPQANLTFGKITDPKALEIVEKHLEVLGIAHMKLSDYSFNHKIDDYFTSYKDPEIHLRAEQDGQNVMKDLDKVKVRIYQMTKLSKDDAIEKWKSYLPQEREGLKKLIELLKQHEEMPKIKILKPKKLKNSIETGNRIAYIKPRIRQFVLFDPEKLTISNVSYLDKKPRWKRYLGSIWQPALTAAIGAGGGFVIGMTTLGFLSIPAMIIGGLGLPLLVLGTLALFSGGKKGESQDSEGQKQKPEEPH